MKTCDCCGQPILFGAINKDGHTFCGETCRNKFLTSGPMNPSIPTTMGSPVGSPRKIKMNPIASALSGIGIFLILLGIFTLYGAYATQYDLNGTPAEGIASQVTGNVANRGWIEVGIGVVCFIIAGLTASGQSVTQTTNQMSDKNKFLYVAERVTTINLSIEQNDLVNAYIYSSQLLEYIRSNFSEDEKTEEVQKAELSAKEALLKLDPIVGHKVPKEQLEKAISEISPKDADKFEKIEKLHKLYQSGAITQEEFEAKKQQILKEI